MFLPGQVHGKWPRVLTDYPEKLLDRGKKPGKWWVPIFESGGSRHEEKVFCENPSAEETGAKNKTKGWVGKRV